MGTLVKHNGDNRKFPHQDHSSKLRLLPPFRHISLASSVVSATPASVQPYLRLSRMDKPIGSWLLFWPCGWSACLATPAGQLPDLQLIALFGLGSFVMRGAGCTINDMWDRNIDRLVERTKDRPITSGQVGMFDALVYTRVQLSLGLMVLLQLNWEVVLPLYLAGISWTMIYDTIYAHQDKYDDVILGVKSTAIKFGDQTPVCLSCFASLMTGCLVYCGWSSGQTWPYYLSVATVAAHLTHQIKTLNIHDTEDCARKFRSNRFVGLIIFLGLIGGSLNKTEDRPPLQVQDLVDETRRVVDNEKILAGVTLSS